MTPNQAIDRLKKLPCNCRIEEMGTVAQVVDPEWEPLAVILTEWPCSLEAALTKLRAFTNRTNIPASQICELWQTGKLMNCQGMFLTLTEDADGSWEKIA